MPTKVLVFYDWLGFYVCGCKCMFVHMMVVFRICFQKDFFPSRCSGRGRLFCVILIHSTVTQVSP